jgi:outer membrane protein TolC
LKRVIFIVIIAVIASTLVSAYAAEGRSAAITREEAREIAVRNSRQLELDDLQIQRLEKAYQRAIDQAKALPDAYGLSNVLSNKINRIKLPFDAETNLEAAKRSKKDHTENLKIDVEKTILSILFAYKELENEKLRLEIEQQRYDNMMAKYRSGSLSEYEKIAAEYDFENKKLRFRQYEQKLSTLDAKLKNLLGYSLESDPLKVEGDIIYEPYGHISIDAIVELAIANDTDIYKSERTLEIRRQVMEITASYYKEGDDAYDDALYELTTAEEDLKGRKLNLEVKVKNAYNDLLNLQDDVLVARGREEVTRKLLESARKKYENGLISKDALMTEEQKYRDDALAVLKAETNYMIKKLDFSKWTK